MGQLAKATEIPAAWAALPTLWEQLRQLDLPPARHLRGRVFGTSACANRCCIPYFAEAGVNDGVREGCRLAQAAEETVPDVSP